MAKHKKSSKSGQFKDPKIKIVPIKGMHCRSCEILIEEELLKVDGVHKVNVSEKLGTAEIYYEGELSDQHIEGAVTSSGYIIGKDTKNFISTNPGDYKELLIAGIVLVVIYYVARALGLFNIAFNSANNLASLPVVFIVGLTAGLSTCMALVGGLVLGITARFAEKHPNVKPIQKFKPHIFFNLGRIFFFLIFGGLIGLFGSVLQPGPSSIGLLTIFVGIVMLILGLQTIQIFPGLNRVKFTLPKRLYKLLGIDSHKNKEYSNKGSFLLGGLTFFVPCGFTQAMQLYAISSGNMITGALTMGVFSLGTAPGLLGIGGLTSAIKGAFSKPFFKFVGLTVIALAVFNIGNGFNLTGIVLPQIKTSENASANTGSNITDPNVTLENGIQIVRMKQSYNGYSPRSFTIQNGIPVKWIVNSTDANTCASSIYSSQLGIKKTLKEGENIIEFTPAETGTIRFSCSMGMYTGSFKVVDISSNGSNVTDNTNSNNTAFQGCSMVSGSGGCGIKPKNSGSGQFNPDTSINTEPTQPETSLSDDSSNNNTQVIKTVYTKDKDILPNSFTVKVNQPVRFEIDPKESGYGCMASVAIPGLSQEYFMLQKNQKIVFEFTPEKKGTYQITCAMGVPRGTIKVN